ncbi:MAG: CreA family protein [Gammaproteobacteria bacterium]|nr:CreA family protein [Gammaproteobacteria bacterium]
MKHILAFAAILATDLASAEQIGHVDTVFKWIGPDHKIVVEAFDDPLVQGISCYVSRAKTGGVKGALGLAEDPSKFSVSCAQTGPLKFLGKLPERQSVFKEGASFIFKHVQVVRMVDARRNALIYLTYSDRVIEGSPENSVTAFAVQGQKIPLED